MPLEDPLHLFLFMTFWWLLSMLWNWNSSNISLSKVRMIMRYFNDTQRRTHLFFFKKMWMRVRENRNRGREKQDHGSNIERKYAVETDRCVCSLPLMLLTVTSVFVQFSQCEKCPQWLNRRRIIVTETTLLTPQLWPLSWPLGGVGGYRGYACFPERQSYNTAGAKNTHWHRLLTHTKKNSWNSYAIYICCTHSPLLAWERWRYLGWLSTRHESMRKELWFKERFPCHDWLVEKQNWVYLVSDCEDKEVLRIKYQIGSDS